MRLPILAGTGGVPPTYVQRLLARGPVAYWRLRDQRASLGVGVGGSLPAVSDEVVASVSNGRRGLYGPVVTIDADARYNAFGGLCKLATGNLLAVYRKGTSHASADGVIYASQSADGGLTWTAPGIIASPSGQSNGINNTDARDACAMVCADGTVIVTFSQSSSSATNFSPWSIRSTDNGATWSSAVLVTNSYTATTLKGFCSSPALQIPSGNLLLPLYGKDSNFDYVRLCQSTDEALTWSDTGVVIAPNDSLNVWDEPNLCILNDGRLLCTIRYDSGANAAHACYGSYSSDNGATWTAPALLFTDCNARPAVIATPDGDLVVATGNTATPRLGYVRVSADSGSTWSAETPMVTDGDEFDYAQLGLVGSQGLNGSAALVESEVLTGGGNTIAGTYFRKLTAGNNWGSVLGPLGATNLCPNPNFEHDTAGTPPAAWQNAISDWTANAGNSLATLTVVASGAQTGSQCLQVSTTIAASREGATVPCSVQALFRTVYQATFWLKGNAGGEAVTAALGDVVSGHVTSTNLTLTTSWQQFTITYVANQATIAAPPLYLSITSTTATASTFFIDQVCVANGFGVPYFDGDTSGNSWQGTAGNSYSVQPAGVAQPQVQAKVAATNLCPNPNFEHDTAGGGAAGWASYSGTGETLTVQASGAQTGSQCLKMVTNSGAAHQGAKVFGTTNSMTNGQTYWVSVWLKGNAGGELLTLLLGDLGSGQATQATVVLSKDWQQFWVAVKATANRTSLEFVVYTTASSTLTWFMDSVMVCTGSAVAPDAPYFDGDQSGNSWAGTVGNSASTQPSSSTISNLPGALTHDTGASALLGGGYVAVPDAAALNITGDVTIEGWIKPTAVTGTQVLMSKLSGTAGYEFGLNGTHLYFTAGGTSVTDTAVISAGAWQYVAVTLSGSTVQFYVGGVATGTGTGAVPTGSSAALTLGANATPANYYKGQMQEFAVHGRAASASELSGQFALA